MSEQLNEQGIIITGAAAGLGRAIAERLRDEGAQVHICDIDKNALRSFTEANPDIGASLADVSVPAAFAKLFEEAV